MGEPIVQVKWKDEPDEHDYPAAADYLELLGAPDVVQTVIEELRSAKVAHKKAKDILRASGLDLVDASNPYVRRDLAKIAAGKTLSLSCWCAVTSGRACRRRSPTAITGCAPFTTPMRISRSR